MPRALPIVLLVALLWSPVAAEAPLPDFRRYGVGEPNRGLRRVPVVIETASGRHRYLVEVAASAEEQATGMMHRREMAADSGMLFPMHPPRPASFWMRNTFVSLDIIFIGADGRVLNVAERAEPLSDRLIPSKGAAAAVLELKAGEARRIGLRAGDRVRWPDGIGGGAGGG